MSEHVDEFYSESPNGPYRQGGHFHKVLALHEDKSLEWESLSKEIPVLPRGWFELSRLSIEDRIEFTRDYWFSKLPLGSDQSDQMQERLNDFFSNLEDVGIFATQSSSSTPFEVHMVYSLKDDSGFFHGYPPASIEAIATLCKQFGNLSFPPDYLSFLEIHDGFSKYTDTGLIRIRDMSKTYQKFQQFLAQEIILTSNGEVIDPKSLIPFYESFGLHCYQCFFSDWYPDAEMGNIYYSEMDKQMSDFLDQNHLDENLSFRSFLHWLTFYIEDIGHL